MNKKNLKKKELKIENDQNLKFREDFNSIMDNISKQKQILEDCRQFYFLLRSQDEKEDTQQKETAARSQLNKKRHSTKINPFEFGNIKKEKQGGSEKVEDRPLTAEEEAFLQKWDQYSKEMDETLEEVYNEMEIMLGKLDVLDQEVDKNIDLTKGFKSKLDGLNEDLKYSNEHLKKIVTELRSPGKICADLSLLLILSLMIAVLVYVVRIYLSLEE